MAKKQEGFKFRPRQVVLEIEGLEFVYAPNKESLAVLRMNAARMQALAVNTGGTDDITDEVRRLMTASVDAALGHGASAAIEAAAGHELDIRDVTDLFEYMSAQMSAVDV
ncbi:MAG: hypothetical protein IJB67_01875 [Firmicutes bacterium]|nr:hypothetical protein [Bacillota bacterium]